MFSNLGYVGGGAQQHRQRDSVFIGSSSHPSKKVNAMRPRRFDLMSADGAYGDGAHFDEPRAAPSEVTAEATLLQRCEFLERQVKRSQGEAVELRAQLDRMAEEASGTHSVTATLLADSVAVDVMADERPRQALYRCSDAACHARVASGQDLLLVYPMEELRANTEVWMQNKIVDPTTGQLQWRWVRIATRDDGLCVGNFKVV